MSLLTERGRVADTIDPIGIGRAIDTTVATPAEQDGAWALIRRMCPDDADELGRMLGVIV